MAIINCLECSKPFSSSISACPYCDAPNSQPHQARYEPPSQKSPQQIKFENIVGFGIVGIIFIVMMLCCFGSKRIDEDEVNREFNKTRDWEIKRGDIR